LQTRSGIYRYVPEHALDRHYVLQWLQYCWCIQKKETNTSAQFSFTTLNAVTLLSI